MSRIIKSRRALVLGVVAALGIAAAAFAYWTTSGSGSGTGLVGSDVARTVNGTIDNALAPGGQSSVTLTANRDINTSYKIGAITGSVSVDSAHSGCQASDFAFTGPTTVQTVPAGSGTQTLAPGSISMTNSSSNQDACKGATLSITLAAAAPAAGA
jgi:D-serine deaminase-like pyridoxal phosphate-dependent protein